MKTDLEKEMQPDESRKGKTLLFDIGWDDYRRNNSVSFDYRIWGTLLVTSLGILGIIVIILNSGPLYKILLLLIMIIAINISLYAIFSIYMKYGWFAVFEKGLNIREVPKKYIKSGKRFVFWNELAAINLEMDEHTSYGHNWRFRIDVDDGHCFTIKNAKFGDFSISNDEMDKALDERNESLYQILLKKAKLFRKHS